MVYIYHSFLVHSSARTWCPGRTWREQVGREVGGGDQDGEDMGTQGLFISMYDKIHYKLKINKGMIWKVQR